MSDLRGRLAGGRGAILCTLLLALAAAGCGSSDPSEAVAEREIQAMLERVYMSGDPDACADSYTQNAFDQLRAISHTSSPLESCESQMQGEPWNVAKSVVLTHLEIDGDAATATIVPAGGEYDGSAISLRLANRAGWRIDRIGRLEIFNRRRFVRGWLRDGRRNGSTDRDQMRCIEGWIRTHVSTEQFERVFVEPQAHSYLADAVTRCIGHGSERRAMLVSFRERLIRSYELSYAQADCIVNALESWLVRYPLERSYLMWHNRRFQAAQREAGRICIGDGGPQGLAGDSA